MGRSIFNFFDRTSYQRSRLKKFVTIRNCTCVLTKTQTDRKGTKKTDRHTQIFVGQRRMAILCRPELVLFPACCCVIMLRLVYCFRYSWCVARLMRAGPRPDWPRRKPFRTKYPYHRLASFFSKKRMHTGSLFR